MVTPLTMQIALAYLYTSTPAQVVGVSWDTEPGRGARLWLLSEGLISDAYPEPDYKGLPLITEKGKAWVERALATPLPVQAWTFPEEATS